MIKNVEDQRSFDTYSTIQCAIYVKVTNLHIAWYLTIFSTVEPE